MQKRNLFKKIAAMAMAMILAVSLTACGGGEESTETSSGSGDNTLDVIAWSSMFTDAQCQAIKEATGITVYSSSPNFIPPWLLLQAVIHVTPTANAMRRTHGDPVVFNICLPIIYLFAVIGINNMTKITIFIQKAKVWFYF